MVAKYNLIVLLLAVPTLLAAQQEAHRPIVFPDAGACKVLKCDFHVHTVFSDGSVWPEDRVQEALAEGLDAIAITDHIEYRPRVDKYPGDHNKSFLLASNAAKGTDLIVIKGSEITRGMPPGHWNALFIKDAVKLDTANYVDAYKEAIAQGGFLEWNHPGWERQAPNRTVMPRENRKYLRAGYMMGIEVYNTYGGLFPEAFKWALKHGLTLLSGTDCHAPMDNIVSYEYGEHRAVTLVLAEEKSAEAIHKALVERRTAIYCDEDIYGRERELEEIFSSVLTVVSTERKGDRATLVLRNGSSMPVYLRKAKGSEALMYERYIKIRPFGTHTFSIRPVKEHLPDGSLRLNFTVENFHTSLSSCLPCSFVID